MPSQAIREWDEAPIGVLEEILELRQFERYIEAYRAHERQPKDHPLPSQAPPAWATWLREVEAE